MVIGALVFPRLLRRYDDPRPIAKLNMWLMAGCCVPVMLGAGVWHALLLVPLWLLGGICNGGLNVSMNVVMAARVPAFARGRAFASMGSAVQGAGMIGFLIGGPLVDRVEPRALFVAFGAAGAAGGAGRACPRSAGPCDLGHPRTRSRTASCSSGIASGHERHRPASPGRAHPVPELPADLLGPDALRRPARRRSAQGHPGPAERRAGRRRPRHRADLAAGVPAPRRRPAAPARPRGRQRRPGAVGQPGLHPAARRARRAPGGAGLDVAHRCAAGPDAAGRPVRRRAGLLPLPAGPGPDADGGRRRRC